MRLIVVVGLLVLLGACGSDVKPSPVAIQIPTPQLQATRTVPPAVTQTPHSTATPAPPSPPRLLVDRDPELVRTRFADAATTGWLVTRSITSGTFDLASWRDQTMVGASRFVGMPFHWTSDGALLLMSDPRQPMTLLGLEPTSGITTTVLTTTFGVISDAYWLREAIIYTAQTTDTTLLAFNGRTSTTLATLPQRQLVPAGLVLSPDQQTFALMVTHPLSGGVELYTYQREQQQLIRVDQSLRGTAAPRAVWSADGVLAYYIGDDFRIYTPAQAQIQTTNLGAEPLAWQGQRWLVRSLDSGALVAWSPTLVQPFSNGNGAILVSDVQVLDQRTLALLIDGQIWLTEVTP